MLSGLVVPGRGGRAGVNGANLVGYGGGIKDELARGRRSARSRRG